MIERNVLRVHTFGRLHVRNAGGVVTGAAAQPRRLALLALLASAGDFGLTREKVLAYLWADTEEDRARRGLSQAVYALRQDLGADDVFLGGREDLRLNPDTVTSDVGEFQSALSTNRPLDLAAARTPATSSTASTSRCSRVRALGGGGAREPRAPLCRVAGEAGATGHRRGDAAEAVGWWRKLAARIR